MGQRLKICLGWDRKASEEVGDQQKLAIQSTERRAFPGEGKAPRPSEKPSSSLLHFSPKKEV